MGNQGYIYSNSFVHKLNPALKFIGFILMIILIFLPLGYFGQLIVGSMVMIGFVLSKLSGRTLFNILKSVIILFALLLLVNWAIYKEPIAVYLNTNDYNLIGNISNQFLIHDSSNIYISELWGGTNPIIFDPNNTSLIEKIISQNKINQSQLDTAWNSLDEGIRENLKNAFNSNLTLAQKYYWIISQPSWELDGIKYNIQEISNAPLIVDGKIAPSFIYYTQNWYTLSPNAINLALYVSIKVFLMIVLATLLTATTSAIELTNGLQTIFSPLKIFKLPVNEMSMMIAIALRFVPSLLIESKRILNAQASRGVDFHNGGMITKLKALTSLVVPLFSIAFKNADDLANAMEARGYNPRKARTKYRLLSVRWYDWFAFGGLGLVLGLFIGLLATNFVFGPFGIFELGILLG